MVRPFYTPDEEQQMLTEMSEVGNRRAKIRSQLSNTDGQALSDLIADMNLAFPNVQGDVLLAASQAVTSGVMSEPEAFNFVRDFQNTALENATTAGVGSGGGGGGTPSAGQEEPPGWFSRNIKDPLYSALKFSARSNIAALSFVEQLGQAAITRTPYEIGTLLNRTGDTNVPFYNISPRDDEEVIAYRPTESFYNPKALLESTDIYQLLSGKDTGQGFFVGDEAKAAQEAASVRYRGGLEIPSPHTQSGTDVVGMTGGRLAGLQFANPGSEAFNNVSGLVDAAYVLTAPTGVPTATAAAKLGTAAASSATKGSLRTLYGLTNGYTPFVRPEKVAAFLSGGTGQRLIREVAALDNVSDARRLLPNAEARTWNDLVQTQNETEALSVLERVLGAERGAMTASEMNWSSWNNVKGTVLRNPVSRYLGIERKLTRAPSRSLVIGFATDKEITETVKSAEDWLKIVYKSPAERNPVLNRLTAALLENKGDIKNSINEFRSIFADSLERFGIPREVADDIFERGIKEGEEMSVFNALDDSGIGAVYDTAARKFVFEDENGNLVQGAFSDRSRRRGWIDSEHARYRIEMPDPRAVQRLTKPMNWFFNRAGVNKAGKEVVNPPLPKNFLNEAGKPRFPVAITDYLHNRVFNRAALGAGGYGFRIAIEGLFAQSFAPGIRTGVFHPIELASALLFRRKKLGRFRGPIAGKSWDDSLGTFKNKADADKVLDESAKDAVEFVEGGLTTELNAGVLEKATHNAGAWRPATRGEEFYLQGVADNVHLLANDRISRLIAEGKTPQEIIDLARQGDREILSALKDFEFRKANEGFVDATGQTRQGSFKIFDKNGNVIQSNAVGIIETYFIPRFRAFTVGDQRLIDIVKNGSDFGKFLPTGAAEEVTAFTKLRTGLFGPEVTADYSDEFYDVLKEVLDANPDAFPLWVKSRNNRATNVITGVPESQRAVLQSWNNFMRRLFSNILTRPDKTLNRSVVWRKYYHEGIDLLLPQLDEGEAAKIVANLQEAAAKEGSKFTDAWAGRYIGSREVWDRISSYANGTRPATGSRTLEEVNAIARGFASDRAMEVLYNATEKNNLNVALSVLDPFVNAAKDGITRWPRLLLSQPNETKRLYNSFEGLANADPDQDGRGYFYLDPNTQQWSYAYPTELLSNEIVGAILYGSFGTIFGGAVAGIPGAIAGAGLAGSLGYSTGQAVEESGLDPYMVGQLRTANVALSAIPSGGPVVKFPLNRLLTWGPTKRLIPGAEEIYAFLNPYGEQSPEAIVLPSWAQKFADVITSNPNTPALVADARIQAWSALKLTGRYTSNATNDDARKVEQAQMDSDLEADAAQIAEALVMYRALGQFILPMRPKIELKIPTQFEGQITINDIETIIDGNISDAILARAFGLLNQQDPTTAVPKFLEFFGDDAINYMVGKTYAKVDGVQATQEFDKWRNDNPDLVKAVGDVYPYFAGRLGTGIDFSLYGFQLSSGERERWDDPGARQQSAEYYVGSRLYSLMLQSMDYDPNPAQRERLAEYKKELEQLFPGYGFAPFDVNRLPRKIAELEKASLLPEALTTEAGTGMRSYFEMRNRVLEAADARGSGLGTAENSDLRAVLWLHGVALTQKYPSFLMVWDDVLSREIDG